jgi:hypothetical protein
VRLLSTTEFTARLASPYTDTELATSELLLDDKPTGLIVTGAVLEAALEWQGCRIAFFTDDIPFEEALNIYLLDQDLNVIDLARMCYMYATGVFSDLDLSEPDTVRFRFFGQTIYALRLFPKKAFALPFFSDPTGVHRPFRFFRMFHLQEQQS